MEFIKVSLALVKFSDKVLQNNALLRDDTFFSALPIT